MGIDCRPVRLLFFMMFMTILYQFCIRHHRVCARPLALTLTFGTLQGVYAHTLASNSHTIYPLYLRPS